jgi:hypothetical protein
MLQLQQVVFKIDYVVEQIGNREFGSVFLGQQDNLAIAVASNGWAKVRHCYRHQIPSLVPLPVHFRCLAVAHLLSHMLVTPLLCIVGAPRCVRAPTTALTSRSSRRLRRLHSWLAWVSGPRCEGETTARGRVMSRHVCVSLHHCLSHCLVRMACKCCAEHHMLMQRCCKHSFFSGSSEAQSAHDMAHADGAVHSHAAALLTGSFCSVKGGPHRGCRR